MVALLHAHPKSLPMANKQQKVSGWASCQRCVRISAKRDEAVNWAIRANACLQSKICHIHFHNQPQPRAVPLASVDYVP